MLTTIDKTSATTDHIASEGALAIQPKGPDAAVAPRPKRSRKTQPTTAPLASSNPPTDSEASVSDAESLTAPVRKSGIVLNLLRREGGATLVAMMDRTGWQAHSVRGFLSGTVRKKLALNLVSDVGNDGVRHYRIDGGAARADRAEPIELPAFGPFRSASATGVAATEQDG